jgi:hypothetical protein
MTRIATAHYRRKRPPKKRKALKEPAIVREARPPLVTYFQPQPLDWD